MEYISLMATRISGRETQIDRPPVADLGETWKRATAGDGTYLKALDAVATGQRKFPPELKLKTSVSECDVTHGKLRYRERKWVPDSEELRSRLISEAHDGLLTGHPGRENTYKALAQDFFWPRMSSDIRRYIRNCDTCGRVKLWRDLKLSDIRGAVRSSTPVKYGGVVRSTLAH